MTSYTALFALTIDRPANVYCCWGYIYCIVIHKWFCFINRSIFVHFIQDVNYTTDNTNWKVSKWGWFCCTKITAYYRGKVKECGFSVKIFWCFLKFAVFSLLFVYFVFGIRCCWLVSPPFISLGKLPCIW